MARITMSKRALARLCQGKPTEITVRLDIGLGEASASLGSIADAADCIKPGKREISAAEAIVIILNQDK